ncbi:nectin-2-like [Brienomyrus brachyistius]|uniref:nectin-2-like n=1 Tax=Brienomyrus brachyistius TaxID=42636 RepID=UPI0020B2AA25|nr:nectin-2-like [Brienomyrus brachyistius]XP_048849618.1 nectin-2-like [Brienomyrus brachyistius]XP_048849619.1 nectin-2-like [Brienomyrus brachyistius]XP_048849620.1 nectin-2-like [Brienomyrus brachyistius]XP_048849621.1 nectin-2-like [Brienomyrus brachyistius]XP_048849622.1 nectin-2-like [Brienomyrus brachyistius]XP_048849623.1 nectin-2-like [Brienomyrus brachyistius]XP_048849624.1 nectin-2-like [Brienomyrus brachyistius]XP_048849625.1 nectin-2-like [Brienomyrus brachyistius]XP_04884962
MENPSIQVSGAKTSDSGTYTCEYATYPSGTEQASSAVFILAKPQNNATMLPVIAGKNAVVVARCESAKGQPAGQVFWDTTAAGNHSNTTKLENDNTVSVVSEFRLIPTAADNGRDITCIIKHRAQKTDDIYKMKLAVQYPPTVYISGYDGQWYVGRSNVQLTCVANANPPPTSFEWTVASGQMPKTAQITGNKLSVPKVDASINTTFACEAKNLLGSGQDRVTTLVTAEPPPGSSATSSIIGAIIGILIVAALIGTGLLLYCRRRNRSENGDGPPSHKPPPPTRAGGSTEMLNRNHGTLLESQPLDMYYETSHDREPITDLDADDDDENVPNGNSGVRNGLEDSPEFYKSNASSGIPVSRANLPDHLGQQEDEVGQAVPAHIGRGDSFISSAMLV